MKFHCMTHVDFEGPAGIKNYAMEKGHDFIISKSYENEFPESTDYDVLVSMGGPMSVNDYQNLSWINKEKEIIERALKQNKKIIGVCLGAQLIASVLGSEVRKNSQKEIGWFDIEFTKNGLKKNIFSRIPRVFPVFHWHGEMFEIPAGADHIMRSSACENQGFLYNENVLALQFHMEGTYDSIISMMENSLHEMSPGDYVQSEKFIRENTREYLLKTQPVFNEVMDAFLMNK